MRFITRTHYQADEPAYVGAVVLACTSPTHGNYRERVAKRLVDALGRRGKALNLPAANYVVTLTQRLGLVREDMLWTDHGHLFSLVASI